MVEIKAIGGRVLYVAKDTTDVRSALESAVLAGAYLAGACLAGAYLDGACLDEACLAGANLAGANLTGAYLDGANLAGANLARACLDEANLTEANLTGAYLDGANLDGAYLDGATWSDVANVLRDSVAAMNDSGRHWIKGAMARTIEDGSMAYCSIGSVEHTAQDDGTIRAIALWLLGQTCAGDIAAFNDHPQTTWEDVQAVFAISIRHAERMAS